MAYRDPNNSENLLLCSFQQWRQLVFDDKIGSENIGTDEKHGHPCRSQGVFYIVLLFRTHSYLSIIPDRYSFASQKRLQHYLKLIQPFSILVAVANEYL